MRRVGQELFAADELVADLRDPRADRANYAGILVHRAACSNPMCPSQSDK